MRTHEPAGYDCPFCRIQRGGPPQRGLADDVLQSLTLEIAALAVHLLRDQDVRR